MKNIYTKLNISLVALMVLISPVGYVFASGDAWYDTGSYYNTSSWTDSGSYYSPTWTDSGSYYSPTWTDSGSYYNNSWTDSGSYYSPTWYDSGSYYNNSWTDSGSYYSPTWTDSGSYYNNSWIDSGSYYSPTWYDSGSYYNNSWTDSGSYYPSTSQVYNTAPVYSSVASNYNYGYDYMYDYGYDYGYNYGYDYGSNYGCTTGCGGYITPYVPPVYVPPVTTKPNPPKVPALQAVCVVSTQSIKTGSSVTFTANATGGQGAYKYSWSGAGLLNLGNTKSVTRQYNTEGMYYGQVKVTDSKGNSASANCAAVQVQKQIVHTIPMNAVCVPSSTSIREGQAVTFTANATGGQGTYTYAWSGSVTGTTRSITKVYPNAGTFSATVRVTDSKGNSVSANCETIRVIQEYVPPVQDLNLICTTSHSSIREGDSVTFTATATGGRSPYTYIWSGDASGTQRVVTRQFNNPGTYSATVRVTDADGRTASANCGTVRVIEDYVPPVYNDLDVVCRVSDSRPDTNERVTFTADATGGRSSYSYRWYGDVNGSGRTVTERFTYDGTKYVTVQVTDRDGRQAVAECPVVRVNDDRDTYVSSGVISSGTTYIPPAPLASVGSVYLNQVPYTGPEDVAKAIAFIVGILVWSIAGALIIRNRMNKKAISNNIAAFKEANKASRS